MSQADRKEKIKLWWSKARRYTNKLRFQARLQKMAESNLKEMMIDDIAEDIDEQSTIIDNKIKIDWYYIDTDRTFCKLWNSLITCQIIYTLVMAPLILVFPDIY